MNRSIVMPARPVKRTTLCALSDVLIRLHSPRLAFCYPQRLDPEYLRRGLAQVLSDYSLFTGRIGRQGERMTIEHGAFGVPFEVQERTETVAELVRQTDVSSGTPLCPQLPIVRVLRGKAPVFAVRITNAADGGVLSVNWQHALGDMQTMMLMLRAWSQACRGLDYGLPLDVPDREAFAKENLTESPVPYSKLRIMSLTECMRYGWMASRGMPRINLAFSHDELAAIQERVCPDRSVTLDDAAWAHLFAVMRRLMGRQDEASDLVMAVNVRRRCGLPDNLLGNFVGTVAATMNPEDNAADVARELRKLVKGYASTQIHLRSTLDFVSQHSGPWERWRHLPTQFNPDRGHLFVSTIQNFGLYDLVFGSEPVLIWGTPSDKPVWWGSAFESPRDINGRPGRVISLWVPPDIAKLMLSDEARAQLRVPESRRDVLRARGTPRLEWTTT